MEPTGIAGSGAELMRRLSSDKGVALLIVLVLTALLVLFSMELSTVASIDLDSAAAHRDEVRAYYLARGAVELAVSSLLSDETPVTAGSEQWGRLPQNLPVGEGRMRVRVHDEGGKLNLNALLDDEKKLEVLDRLFFILGLDPSLTANLLDWMDEDNEERGPGTEGAYYQGLRSPYPVKNAPLDTLSELRNIKGYGNDVLESLGSQKRLGSLDLQTIPFFTLHSGGKVNVNTAPPSLLMALSESLTEDVAQAIVESRQERAFEKVEELRELPEVTGELFSEIENLLTVESNHFSISAWGEVNGVRKHIFAVVKKEEGEVSVLYWRTI